MTESELKEGDIVEIDYIQEFTKEHINEGKALIVWKGFNHQPLVRKLNTKKMIWTCYEQIARVVGHIDIESYMDKALEQEPCDDAISRQAINELQKYRYNCGDTTITCVSLASINELPSVTHKTGHWIKIKPYPLQMHDYECSECGHETDDNTENYCSECGTKMEVGKYEC